MMTKEQLKILRETRQELSVISSQIADWMRLADELVRLGLDAKAPNYPIPLRVSTYIEALEKDLIELQGRLEQRGLSVLALYVAIESGAHKRQLKSEE
jgi:hypothetical protein